MVGIELPKSYSTCEAVSPRSFLEQLIPPQGGVFGGAFSPDNKWLAYVSDETGKDEEHTRERSGGVSALAVTDVDRKLQRLRPRKHMAEVECADEFLFVQPLLPLDDLEMHQADPADGSAESEPAQLEEVPEELPHCRLQGSDSRGVDCCDYRPLLVVGTSWERCRCAGFQSPPLV